MLGQQSVIDTDDTYPRSLGDAGCAGEHGAWGTVNKSPAVGPYQYWSGVWEPLRPLNEYRDRVSPSGDRAVLENHRIRDRRRYFSPQAGGHVILTRPLLGERLFFLRLTTQDFCQSWIQFHVTSPSSLV